jgi:hypothetical protein
MSPTSPSSPPPIKDVCVTAPKYNGPSLPESPWDALGTVVFADCYAKLAKKASLDHRPRLVKVPFCLIADPLSLPLLGRCC